MLAIFTKDWWKGCFKLNRKIMLCCCLFSTDMSMNHILVAYLLQMQLFMYSSCINVNCFISHLVHWRCLALLGLYFVADWNGSATPATGVLTSVGSCQSNTERRWTRSSVLTMAPLGLKAIVGESKFFFWLYFLFFFNYSVLFYFICIIITYDWFKV